MESERAEYLSRILGSDSRRKIIVAGPGTGKTYTFNSLLKQISGNCLALTFLNALANDMAEELGDAADTRTFHSFCRMLLHKSPGDGITARFHFFPKLEQLLVIDALASGNQDASARNYFRDPLQALIEDDGRIDFFLNRANFYGAVGFDDSVYRVLKIFRADPEHIPEYDQVVVDEYQDFNALEVEFIDHLAAKSPIMIVGDDDQAIYDFKAASPEFLRKKAGSDEFERLELPFCSRCTEVVVVACNRFLAEAVKQGNLQGRIDKQYRCYLPDKEADNAKYPKIIKAQCTVNNSRAPYIARYIEKIVQSIDDEEIQAAIGGRYPVALIVGPSHYLRQINAYLQEKFANVVYKPRQIENLAPIDGYKALIEDPESNLGWRIATWTDDSTVSNEALTAAVDNETSLLHVLDDKTVENHLAIIDSLKKLQKGEEIGRDGLVALEKRLDLTIEQILENLGLSVEDEVEDAQESTKSAQDHPEIWLTTYNGCKGMSAGFTFVVGLENDELPRNQNAITDNELCQFVVALTRTRKQCHLVSTGRFGAKQLRPSVLLNWIPEDISETVRVDKNYFAE